MLITDFLFLGKFWCRLLQTPPQDILNYICSFPSFHFKLYRGWRRGLFLTFPLQYVKWWKIVLLNNLSDNNNCLWTRILIQFQAEPKKTEEFCVYSIAFKCMELWKIIFRQWCGCGWWKSTNFFNVCYRQSFCLWRSHHQNCSVSCANVCLKILSLLHVG